ncbi:flagellar hook capping FlgD N-terminal domain-containing protein [Telmatospirillum sp.]|uniref:flagellar hook assembly protein FlgD n=1 Tax=Telmatospirillum sp. TaxID=2079197 RepID=UPI00284FE319|nr:flagellar hook capping FlgD N-terminal domain-containing protein [Telmatospirillum sp.]MDR3438085.1 flagellar hook capping FlgD N-terminal domain-containing protein [Telmatospirillum sp.]
MTTTSSVTPVSTTSSGASSTSQTATSAYGLSFNSLLQIILTQLTYQDPLKPMDNFQFVSQLAQFTQVEQGQTMVTDLQTALSNQATSQAAALLGHTVDVKSGSSTQSGVVTAVALSSTSPTITIKTSGGQTISGLAVSAITQIRPGSATTTAGSTSASTSSSSSGS